MISQSGVEKNSIKWCSEEYCRGVSRGIFHLRRCRWNAASSPRRWWSASPLARPSPSLARALHLTISCSLAPRSRAPSLPRSLPRSLPLALSLPRALSRSHARSLPLSLSFALSLGKARNLRRWRWNAASSPRRWWSARTLPSSSALCVGVSERVCVWV